MLPALESLAILTLLPLVCLAVPVFLALSYLVVPTLLSLLSLLTSAIACLTFSPMYVHGNFCVDTSSDFAIDLAFSPTMPPFFDFLTLGWFL